jgi:hypothetical protein
MTKRICFVAFALAIALAVSCVRGDDSDSTVTLKSDDGKVQLIMPVGWVKLKSSNSGAALETRNDDYDGFVMVIITDRSDPYEPLEDHAKGQRDEILSHLVNSRYTGPDEVTVESFKGLQYEIHGTAPASKVDFGYFLTVVQMRRHYLEIVSWSIQRNFAKNADDLKSAAKNASYSGDE